MSHDAQLHAPRVHMGELSWMNVVPRVPKPLLPDKPRVRSLEIEVGRRFESEGTY